MSKREFLLKNEMCDDGIWRNTDGEVTEPETIRRVGFKVPSIQEKAYHDYNIRVFDEYCDLEKELD